VTSAASDTVGETLLPLEIALERMLDGVEPLPVETVAVSDALGRVVGEAIASPTTLPRWDNSAMDGFAVRAEDVAGASPMQPVELRVIGDVPAGHAPGGQLTPGTAMRILTGAMIPAGADAVVPVEETDSPSGLADLPDVVRVHAPASAGAHLRRAGADVQVGAVLLESGAVIGPAALALLIAAGLSRVPVHRRPRVSVLSTGDELMPAGATLKPGQIHDANGPMLVAQARLAGAEADQPAIAPDELEQLVARLTVAARDADVVVVSGGVSVGARDLVKPAFKRLGRLEIWRVAVQPGKPLAFARAERPDGGVSLLFGLPGNPVSSFVTFELFVRPILRRLAGRTDPLAAAGVRARLAEPVGTDRSRRAFVRVRLEPDPDRVDGWLARSAGGQGPYVLSALAAADGLAIVPEGIGELPAGSEVEVRLLDRELSGR
jgi:molybdopterin molybdotransferase